MDVGVPVNRVQTPQSTSETRVQQPNNTDNGVRKKKEFVVRNSAQKTKQNEADGNTTAPRGPRKPGWRDFKRKQIQKNNDLKVTVTGYPEYAQAQDLEHLFSQFGTVQVGKMSKEAAHLIFSSIVEVHAALKASNKITLYAECLMVKPYTEEARTRKKPVNRQKPKSVIVSPTTLSLSGDFHQQLDEVLSAVRLSQQEVAAIGQLYADVEHTLQAQWPGCRAIPFGSIPTGLGIKSSDADCFVLLPPPQRRQPAPVLRARRLLQARPETFAGVTAIPRANTPIVKLLHIPTARDCDVSFKTPLGTKNSELVSFLLCTDRRLLPMAVLIKYWAKVHDLTGTGKLTNYALTMLVIAYLQHRGMLPSIRWLQQNLTEEVDDWNVAFMNDQRQMPPNNDKATIPELIGGFFEHYANFNFDELVVCPYMGVPVQRAIFKEPQNLPAEWSRYQYNVLNLLCPPLRFLSAIVVQDPFELCHNVAAPISPLLADKIKVFISFAADAYQSEKLNNCEAFLRKILIEKPNYQEKKQSPEYRIRLPNKIVNVIADPDWMPIFRDAAFDMFEKILKMELVPLEEPEDDPDQQRPREANRKEKEIYTTTITKPVWERKRVRELSTGDFIQRKAQVVEEIIRHTKEDYNVEIQVILIYYYSKSAIIAIKHKNGDQDPYQEFGKYLQSVVQTWIKELLKPYAAKPTNVPARKKKNANEIKENLKDNDPDSASESPVETQTDGQSSSTDATQNNNNEENPDNGS